MCKGGSKKTHTEQEQFSESEQFGYNQANPEAWLPAVEAIQNSLGLAQGAIADPSRLVADLNPWQIEAGTGMRGAWESAIPQYGEAADMSRRGYDLGRQGAETMRGADWWRGRALLRSDRADAFAQDSADPVALQELEIDRYLNPYANYALEGLNESLFSKNKKAQGQLTRLMGGIGGDRVGVAEGEALRADNLARGQLMADFYRNATGVAQQQQGAQYTKDVRNRDAMARTAEIIRSIAAQDEARTASVLDQGRGIASIGAQQQGAARSFADIASMSRDSRVQGLLSQGRWGDQYQRQEQALRDAPWKANQFLTQTIAGLAPVIGGFQYQYGTQKSSGEANQTTTTSQNPFQMLAGLGLMGLGAFSGNPMLAMQGVGAFSGNSNAGSGEQPPTYPMYNPPPFAPTYGMAYARGGKVKANPYDIGGLVFDPELSDELYPVDKDSREFRDLVLNPEQNVYELPKEEPKEEIPERTYYERVQSGDAPDFRDALKRHGESILAAPGNENYLNRNLPPYVPPEEPVSPGEGVRAIETASPRNPMALPSRATAYDEPTTYAPAKSRDRRPIEEIEEEIIRDQLTKRRAPSPELPELPEAKRRKPRNREWGGVDGRLFELGLRLLAGTGDTDRSGVPLGFAAGLGKAGLGVLESDRKHRDEQRKDADYDVDDIKTRDAMQRWRQQLREQNRRHEIDDDTRRLNAVTRSQTARENREERKLRAEQIAEDRRRRLEMDELYKRERLKQFEEDQRRKREEQERRAEALELQRQRVQIAKERLTRGDARWMGTDKDGNAILYDQKLRGEDGTPIVYKVPVGDILPRPRAKPEGSPQQLLREAQQEARRLAVEEARIRQVAPDTVFDKYFTMIKRQWGLEGGPAPAQDNRPPATPPFRSGQDPALATEVARLKNLGRTWPQIRSVLERMGVPNPDLYQD